MKIKYEITAELSDSFILDAINEFQADNDFEGFETIEEMPMEFIYFILDYTGVLSYDFYEYEYDDVEVTIL